MELEDLVLVSVDDHVVEPPDLFEKHAPRSDLDRAPVVVRNEAKMADVWRFGDLEIENIGLNAVAGRPPEEYGFEPTAFDEMRRGVYDVGERVRDMNANGVLGSMCFPSMTGFCGQLFSKTPDRELGYRLLQAYNDWHIDEWCGNHPGRFIPLAIPPAWDPQLMAAEVRRVAAKGCHAITFSENPAKLDFPSLHSDHWDPFWKACEELGTVVCMHIGSSSSQPFTAADAPVDVLITTSPVNIVLCASDLIWSPIFRKFPNLTIALSEGGTGWIPYFLHRIDYVYQRHRAWTHQDFGDKLPSQVFRERIVTCFIEDPVGIELREKVGLDNMTWECDYPHADSSWPQSPELFMKTAAAGLTDEEIDTITHRNAMRIFQYDPFVHRPRQRSTVGALRAESPDVDLVTHSPRVKRSQGATLGSLAAATERQADPLRKA